jgi:hypothetical protein
MRCDATATNAEISCILSDRSPASSREREVRCRRVGLAGLCALGAVPQTARVIDSPCAPDPRQGKRTGKCGHGRNHTDSTGTALGSKFDAARVRVSPDRAPSGPDSGLVMSRLSTDADTGGPVQSGQRPTATPGRAPPPAAAPSRRIGTREALWLRVHTVADGHTPYLRPGSRSRGRASRSPIPDSVVTCQSRMEKPDQSTDWSHERLLLP